MKRVIVDIKKLTPEILSLLVERYPDGYDDDHIITFKNMHNDTIEAVEVRTEDTVYLVKVSARLASAMADFEEEDDDSTTEDNTAEEVALPAAETEDQD
ncbi:hypothetical protein [Gilvibacter sp. SZ-19]|uniref:hypothetical protein n=1 Tax=unclassified Gilvibacter TaxID=2625242 RepID=UPI000B3CB76A|nr:hypothetical protein [Gilvibacter sp. SZ-19]ARV13238.1 hypothetical protein BTO09_13210 [Gilvibacter sp. SZ-19]